MRNEKALITIIRKVADLLSEECTRNPDFAERLAVLLPITPDGTTKKKKPTPRKPQMELPDIYAEWRTRGDTNFRLWLRDLSIPLLHAIIHSKGFDPTRRTTKWKEAEKLADFIFESLHSRLSKGASFIRSGTNENSE